MRHTLSPVLPKVVSVHTYRVLSQPLHAIAIVHYHQVAQEVLRGDLAFTERAKRAVRCVAAVAPVGYIADETVAFAVCVANGKPAGRWG